MKEADLNSVLVPGESYYIAIRRKFAPKGSAAVVRFVEYVERTPRSSGAPGGLFRFKFVDHNFTGRLTADCIVRIGKTPILDEEGAKS